ncbi:hypothetical protein QUA46_21395 [Microcoleus sp. MON2_D6]|uniref:hypothetical protein n=1 Tax=unclassified Microcoleus TaxID=2642155 RepID=UPI002FD27FF6
MFSQKLNEVRERIRHELTGSNPLDFYLYHSTRIWCQELDINKDISAYILRGYDRQPEIKDLTNYIYQEGQIEKPNWAILTRSGFYQYINALFNRMNIRRENMEFIVLIAFAITAIGYWIYILNQQKQQTTRGEEPRQDNPNPLAPTVSTVQTPSIPTPSIPKVTNQFLILVVSHSQADFLKSLVAKSRINSNDGESLYEITKYLWLGSETEYSKIKSNISEYLVAKGEESEYDIYLVYIKLDQADEGFTSNVDQLDRYDAFRKLADLSVNLTISDRLQMEAYGNIEVYNR